MKPASQWATELMLVQHDCYSREAFIRLVAMIQADAAQEGALICARTAQEFDFVSKSEPLNNLQLNKHEGHQTNDKKHRRNQLPRDSA